jgi:hypothetical protein
MLHSLAGTSLISPETPRWTAELYGRWVQLIQLSQAKDCSGDPIRTLHSALKADSPLNREVTAPTDAFRIGDSVITITGVDRWKDAANAGTQYEPSIMVVSHS